MFFLCTLNNQLRTGTDRCITFHFKNKPLRWPQVVLTQCDFCLVCSECQVMKFSQARVNSGSSNDTLNVARMDGLTRCPLSCPLSFQLLPFHLFPASREIRLTESKPRHTLIARAAYLANIRCGNRNFVVVNVHFEPDLTLRNLRERLTAHDSTLATLP